MQWLLAVLSGLNAIAPSNVECPFVDSLPCVPFVQNSAIVDPGTSVTLLLNDTS
jgi:hypothetical protein